VDGSLAALIHGCVCFEDDA